jgi:hypothetical protein
MKTLTTIIAVLLLGATGCDKATKKPAPAPVAKADDPAAEAKPRMSTGLPSCDAYVSAVESYARCEKVPQATRDGAKAGLDTMTQGWGNMSGVPDDVKKQTDDACKQAVTGLTQGAKSMGCDL